MSDERAIGVFDSGVGGLTVLAALLERLPNERFVYLGDTARLPYGSKSAETVRRYARQTARELVDRGIKLLVIACNTASAVALDDLREVFSPLPVVGVIEAGADAAVAATRTGHVLITATEGTVAGGAYQRALRARRADLRIDAVACSMFVALAEEGWTRGSIAEAVARRYLEPELAGSQRSRVDTVVLGCTHFPVLRPVLERVCGDEVTLVDSARTTAKFVEDLLAREDLAARAANVAGPRVVFLATDSPDRFARVGAVFIGHEIAPEDVELVDLAVNRALP